MYDSCDVYVARFVASVVQFVMGYFAAAFFQLDVQHVLLITYSIRGSRTFVLPYHFGFWKYSQIYFSKIPMILPMNFVSVLVQQIFNESSFSSVNVGW